MKLDLKAIEEKWLQQCGACDAGLLMSCTCPQEDYRSVLLELVCEVERLNGRPPSPDIPVWAQEQYNTTQRQFVVAADREAAMNKRCTAEDSGGARCTADLLPEHAHRYRRSDLPRGQEAPSGHERDTWVGAS